MSEKPEIRFFFQFGTFRIFHVNLTSFEKKTIFFSKMFQYLNKSVQIYMKDAEYVESNEKSIFQLLFFEFWSFLYSNHPNFRWIFIITWKIWSENWYFIRFNTLRIFHENRSKTEEGGEGPDWENCLLSA